MRETISGQCGDRYMDEVQLVHGQHGQKKTVSRIPRAPDKRVCMYHEN